ncbi:hypothetical protein PO002_27815 [Cupriavidus necator]|uniref:hypothetical protein n=1 Tax=Cupriavidus necator TaxID=106590 RepID=UPI0039C093B6
MKHDPKVPAALPPGHYWATCRERTPMQALAHDHTVLFPQARCVSDGKRVVFYRDGNEIWACNALYAAVNFDIQPA